MKCGLQERIHNFIEQDPERRQSLQRRRQDNVLNQSLRKQGIKKFRTASHPQQWRVDLITGARKKVHGAFARLGPLGELGDDIVIFINLNLDLISLLQRFEFSITTQKVEAAIFQDIIEPVIKYLDKKIEIWVPVDTTDLRKSLHNALKIDSSIISNPFRVILNTKGVPYAGPVNKMPTASLRKSGKAPQARKGWYNLLLLNGRNLAKRKRKIVINKLKLLFPKAKLKKYFKKKTPYSISKSLFSFFIK